MHTTPPSCLTEEEGCNTGYWKSCLTAALLMLAIVLLLMLWEYFVHALHNHTPKSILPAVEYSLSEIGGLGFIGLLLEISRVHEWVGEEHRGLLELFQFLHIAFFKVATGYFVWSAVMVHVAMVQIQDFREMELEERLPNGLNFTPDQLTLPLTSVWKELAHGYHDRSLEFLTIRHRFLRRYQLPTNFYADVTPLCAAYLEKLIHFSPMIWLPIIPILTMGEAIDMIHGVIDAESEHSEASVGLFYSNRAFWYMVLVWQATTLCLGVYNFYTVIQYKNQAIRQDNAHYKSFAIQSNSLVMDENVDETTELSTWSKSESSIVIPECHLTLVQYHTWLAVTFLVFVLTDVLIRDISSLLLSKEVGNPSSLVQETIAFFVLCVLNALQLVLTPKTFWSFA